jgi:hypothetical protein
MRVVSDAWDEVKEEDGDADVDAGSVGGPSA